MNHSNFLVFGGTHAIVDKSTKKSPPGGNLKVDDPKDDHDPMKPGLGVITGAVLGLLLWALIAFLWLSL